jgi:hypothetical protein
MYLWANVILGYHLSGQMSFGANKCLLGKCLSGQISFWANVLLGKFLLGKCLSGQMSFWANVFLYKCLLGKWRLGKCLSGQMSFWTNVVWTNVLLGKPRSGKCLWANVSGQMSYGQMSWSHGDDTSASVIGKDTEEVCIKLEATSLEVLNYMAANGMAPNEKKTEFMVFRRENKEHHGWQFRSA